MSAYLDSNVFIYAFINTDDLGVRARELLDAVARRKLQASTSYLTVDEFFWELKRHVGRSKALQYLKSLLQTPHLRFVPVDASVMSATYDFLQKYELDPRDAIHAASAITINADLLISEDGDFDKLEEITHSHLIKKK